MGDNCDRTTNKIKSINKKYGQSFFDTGKVGQYKSELIEAYGGDNDSVSSYGSQNELEETYTNQDADMMSKVNYKIPGL